MDGSVLRFAVGVMLLFTRRSLFLRRSQLLGLDNVPRTLLLTAMHHECVPSDLGYRPGLTFEESIGLSSVMSPPYIIPSKCSAAANYLVSDCLLDFE